MTRIKKFLILSLLLLSAGGCASTLEKSLSIAIEKPMVDGMVVATVAQFHRTYGRWPKDASELSFLSKNDALPKKESPFNFENMSPQSLSLVESPEGKCIINFTSFSGFQSKIALEAPNERHMQYVGDYLHIHGAPFQTEGAISVDLTVAPAIITFSKARVEAFAEYEKGANKGNIVRTIP